MPNKSQQEPRSRQPLDPASRALGWIFHGLAIALLLVAFHLSFRNIRWSGFSFSGIQEVPWLLFLYLVLSISGTGLLRSTREIGCSFCIAGALSFIVLIVGVAPGLMEREEIVPVSAWLGVWPLFVAYPLFTIMGSWLLRLSLEKAWKWWLIPFLPCSFVTILVITFLKVPGIAFVAVVWIWYAAVRMLKPETGEALIPRCSRFAYAVARKIAPAVGFVVVCITDYQQYRFISDARQSFENFAIEFESGPAAVALIEAQSWMLSSSRWSIMSFVISACSLLLFIVLETRFSMERKRVRVTNESN